jgi:membrane-associated PAP2 superfamily phosphatase
MAAARPLSRRLHVWLPAAIFALAFFALIAWDLDRRVADAFFYDAGAHAWIGAGSWWAVTAIHAGGGWLVRAIGLGALLVLLLGARNVSLRPWREIARYVVLALALCPAIVAGLKLATDVNCPRDLPDYGGAATAAMPGHCFPGSHASTGFSLMALYFALRDRRPQLARGLLAAGIAAGIVFSLGQQARGAHFLSHDLASAAIAWYVLLGLRRVLLESTPPAATRLISPAPGVQLDVARRDRTDQPHARRRRAGVRSILQRVFRARVSFRPAATQR